MTDAPLIDVLMPYRPASHHRVRIKNANTKLWEAAQFPVRVIVGQHGNEMSRDPFNLAKAANEAFRRSSADIVLLHGTDHLPPDPMRLAWIVDELQHHPWLGVYANTHALTQASTEQILVAVEAGYRRVHPQWITVGAKAPFCTGIMAFRRDAWEQLGGMDERFAGWGCEDTALRLAAETMFGKPPLPYGNLVTMWHSRAKRDQFGANVKVLAEYQAAAVGGAGGMRDFLTGRGAFL